MKRKPQLGLEILIVHSDPTRRSVADPLLRFENFELKLQRKVELVMNQYQVVLHYLRSKGQRDELKISELGHFCKRKKNR